MPASGQLEELLEEYGDTVLKLCICLLLNEERAQDAVEECFVRIAAQPLEKESKFQVLEKTIQVCSELAQTAEHDKGRTDFVGSLMRLSFKQRAAILLRYYMGMSTKETAKLIHVPKAILYGRLVCAQFKLKKIE